MEAKEVYLYTFGGVILLLCTIGPYVIAKELYPVEFFILKIWISTLWKAIVKRDETGEHLLVKTGPTLCRYHNRGGVDVLMFSGQDNNETFSIAIKIDGAWKPKAITKGLREGIEPEIIILSPRQARIIDDYHNLIMPPIRTFKEKS